MAQTQRLHTRTVHTIDIELDDSIIDQIRDSDQVEVVFRSRARNKPMVPIRLSYTTVHRLTQDA